MVGTFFVGGFAGALTLWHGIAGYRDRTLIDMLTPGWHRSDRSVKTQAVGTAAVGALLLIAALASLVNG